jgi:ubiquinone/menaquinone biosynthesis C-methylase UbiE
MPHKFDPANLEYLSSPERLALLDVDRVLSLARVSEGERVLDAGCGAGVFTLPLAMAVGPSGHVFAVDVEPVMVETCSRRVREAGLTNVTAARSGENSFPLPDANVDLVFACHLLHELLDPPAFFAEVRRVLRPGGRVLLVEWEKVEMEAGPPLKHRLSPEEARAVLAGVGLAVTETRSVTWANYLLTAVF